MREGKLLIVAEVDNKIVGSADLRNGERKRIQHVGTVAIIVVKDYRGLGIGKTLMQTLINWASNNSIIEKIDLGVFSNNTRAIKLYKKLGFTKEGHKVKEIKIGPNDYADGILMYKFVK